VTLNSTSALHSSVCHEVHTDQIDSPLSNPGITVAIRGQALRRGVCLCWGVTCIYVNKMHRIRSF